MEIFRAISVLHQGDLGPALLNGHRPSLEISDRGKLRPKLLLPVHCQLSPTNVTECHLTPTSFSYIFTFSLLHQILASLHFPTPILKPQLLHQIELVLLELLIQRALLSTIWIRILSLVTLLFSFDTSAIKDELVPSCSIDRDITRGQSGALRANKMIIY